MRFSATHKLVTYLLAVSALGTLATSNVLPAAGAVAFLVAAALSWAIDPAGRVAALLDRCAPITRGFLVLAFAGAAWSLWAHLPDPDLTPVLYFVLLLLAYKLFHRRGNRDDLHIYVLSFLLVIAAAALGQSALFAIGFAVYVVIATWTMILFHLRREMEENYLVRHSSQAASEKVGVARILNSRRVVGGWFLVATAAVGLAVFAGAVVTFVAVPRIGAGFVFGTPRRPQHLVGFSDEVTLGHFGLLSMDSQAVALRAVLPRVSALASERQRDGAVSALYWRATVYDRYERGHWLRSRRPELRTRLEPHGDGPMVLREPALESATVGKRTAQALAQSERQEIDLVGLPVPVAVALDRPLAFELPPPRAPTLTELRLVPRWAGEVFLRTARIDRLPHDADDVRAVGATHYVAYSRDALSSARASTGKPLAEVDPAVVAAYLEVPASLPPRIVELARKITAGRASAAAKIVAIIEWLRATHEYTVDLKRDTAIEDPLEDFLFSQRAGHCEYFASATVILLRASGVPARYVNGFLGGEWNEIGGYVTVRDKHAHSWAEAYVGELGWMRVDATPPNRAMDRAGRMRQLFDSLEFFWTRWVMSYDLGRQLELARRLRDRVDLGKAAMPAPSAPRAWPVKGLLAGGTALVLVVGILRLRGRRGGRLSVPPPAPSRQAAGVFRVYRRTLERLARRGFARRPCETPHELASRVRTAPVHGADALDRLTQLYTAARFGRAPVDEAVLRSLLRELADIGRPLPRDRDAASGPAPSDTRGGAATGAPPSK